MEPVKMFIHSALICCPAAFLSVTRWQVFMVDFGGCGDWGLPFTEGGRFWFRLVSQVSYCLGSES